MDAIKPRSLAKESYKQSFFLSGLLRTFVTASLAQVSGDGSYILFCKPWSVRQVHALLPVRLGCLVGNQYLEIQLTCFIRDYSCCAHLLICIAGYLPDNRTWTKLFNPLRPTFGVIDYSR